MTVETLLISHPSIDFNTLLGLTHQALGYSIAEAADASYRRMVDAETYRCNKCGTTVTLDDHDDTLPPCPKCDGTEFTKIG